MKSDFQRSPYCFVVGCPRSGTTLLQRLLDHHPLLAVANDTHFIPRSLEKHAPHKLEDAVAGKDIPLTRELVDGVISYRRFHRLGVDPLMAEAMADDCRTYGDYVGALYRLFAQQHGKPLAGEKTPDYVRRLPVLFGLFPGTRVVHIIRDGRDVALSTLQWATGNKGPGRLALWRREPVGTCALWWRRQVCAGRKAAALESTKRYQELRYERLVESPGTELRRLCEFLSLPYAPEMQGFHEGKRRFSSRGSAKTNWLPITRGLRDWRTEMTERDVELFEALCGDLIDALGLDRVTTRVSPSVAAAAQECRDWWEEFHARRSRKHQRRVEAFATGEA